MSEITVTGIKVNSSASPFTDIGDLQSSPWLRCPRFGVCHWSILQVAECVIWSDVPMLPNGIKVAGPFLIVAAGIAIGTTLCAASAFNIWPYSICTWVATSYTIGWIHVCTVPNGIGVSCHQVGVQQEDVQLVHVLELGWDGTGQPVLVKQQVVQTLQKTNPIRNGFNQVIGIKIQELHFCKLPNQLGNHSN